MVFYRGLYLPPRYVSRICVVPRLPFHLCPLKIPTEDTFPAHSPNHNRTINSASWGAGMTEVYIAFLLLVLLVSVILEGIDGLMLLLRSARRRRDRPHTARPRRS